MSKFLAIENAESAWKHPHCQPARPHHPVWAAWDEPAIGATQAIQAAGRNEIVVTGIDGTSQASDMIKRVFAFRGHHEAKLPWHGRVGG
jgi:hypothetical protein